MESKKPFIITVVILVLIILGLGGYIAFDIYVLKKKEENTLTVIDNVSIDLNSLLQVGETLDRLDNAFNVPGTAYTGYIYDKKKIEIANFDQGAAVFAAMYKDLEKTGTNQYINATAVKRNFERMFGKNLKYTTDKVNAGDGYTINYSNNYNVYVCTIPLNKDIYKSGYVTVNTKTALIEEGIVVTRKVYYLDYIIDPSTTAATSAKIYKDASKSQLLGEISLTNTVVDADEVIGKYGSSLLTFEYTFKENNVNDYTLYKIERKK